MASFSWDIAALCVFGRDFGAVATWPDQTYPKSQTVASWRKSQELPEFQDYEDRDTRLEAYAIIFNQWLRLASSLPSGQLGHFQHGSRFRANWLWLKNMMFGCFRWVIPEPSSSLKNYLGEAWPTGTTMLQATSSCMATEQLDLFKADSP